MPLVPPLFFLGRSQTARHVRAGEMFAEVRISSGDIAFPAINEPYDVVGPTTVPRLGDS